MVGKFHLNTEKRECFPAIQIGDGEFNAFADAYARNAACQGTTLHTLMAAFMNAANLWDLLSHTKMRLFTPHHLMAYSYMPSDRNQHPKHTALYVHMPMCMQAIPFGNIVDCHLPKPGLAVRATCLLYSPNVR